MKAPEIGQMRSSTVIPFSLPSPITPSHCPHHCSLTTVTNVIYVVTFAPVVYWIFLSNYFRYCL